MSTLILPRPSTQPDLYFGKYVAGLYAQDRRGLWDDPSDQSTLFQDFVALTPVSNFGQPVGFVLDKSKSVARGPELLNQNLPFSGSLRPGWTYQNLKFTAESVVPNYSYPTTSNLHIPVPGVIINKFYELKFTITAVSGNAGVAFGDANVGSAFGFMGSGTYKIIRRAISSIYFGAVIQTGVGFSGSIEMESVREIFGNHAEQSASVSRPLLRQDSTGAVNLQYDGIDDFHSFATGGGAAAELFFCAAIKVGQVGSVQTLYSNASSNSGYRVRVNAANQLEFSAGNGSGFTTVATSDAMVIDQRAVLTAWSDGARLYAQINNGPVSQQILGSVATGTASATIGRDNGSATSHFMGRIYGLVTCHSQVDATHRSSVQQYLNFKMGGLL